MSPRSTRRREPCGSAHGGYAPEDGISGFHALGRLAKLQVLDLRRQEVTNLGFVRSMRELRRLDLRWTKVQDLSPIARLDRLEEVNADMAPVVRLPTGPLPALRRLTLLSTAVPEKDVAAFAGAHPGCTVHRSWEGILRHHAAGTTRIKMYTGWSKRLERHAEQLLLDIDAPREIARFLDLIEIDESASGPRCKCGGDATFELYRESELVAEIAIHHGNRLRWLRRWPGHARLTGRSAAALLGFLARRGVVPVQSGFGYVRQP